MAAKNENVMQATKASVADFLSGLSQNRQDEAAQLIELMENITQLPPVLWGPSIIGFGSQHYRCETGREGDMPLMAFSPRKAALTVYFNEGFDRYGEFLKEMGKHSHSVSCLYIKKLSDVDLSVLEGMLRKSFQLQVSPPTKPQNVADYLARVPENAKEPFERLRALMKRLLPDATEVLSYEIIGYKTDPKRPKVYIAAWKDHLSLYPLPKDLSLQDAIKPFVRGKGTMHFSLTDPLPETLIQKIVEALK